MSSIQLQLENSSFRFLAEVFSRKLLRRVFPMELRPNSILRFIYIRSPTSFTSPTSSTSTSSTSPPSTSIKFIYVTYIIYIIYTNFNQVHPRHIHHLHQLHLQVLNVSISPTKLLQSYNVIYTILHRKDFSHRNKLLHRSCYRGVVMQEFVCKSFSV